MEAVGQDVADGIRQLALPIVLVVIAVIAGFLIFSREASRVVQLIIMGVVVVALLVTPSVMENAGQWLGGLLGG